MSEELIPSPFPQDFPQKHRWQFFVGVVTPRGPEQVVNLGQEQIALLDQIINSLKKPGDNLPTIITNKL